MKSKTNLTVTITGVCEGPDGVMHVINETYNNITGMVFHGFFPIPDMGKDGACALCIGGISLAKMINILGAMKRHFGGQKYMIANGLMNEMGDDMVWEVKLENLEREKRPDSDVT